MGSSLPYDGVLPRVVPPERESLTLRDRVPDAGNVLDDNAAIQSIRDGNIEEAFSLIFDRYARSVYNIGLRILHNATEAQELVQDVFLRVCEKAHLYRSDGGTFASWLHHIAYTCAFDRREYLNVRHFYDHSDIEEMTAPADELSVENEAELRQWNRILDSALAELDERQRNTLKMFFFEGYSLREISAQLGETLGNTRHHYYRGIKKLRVVLKSYLRQPKMRIQSYANGQ